MKLLFIRHAESIGNREQRMLGHGNFELSAIGRQQAQTLAKHLWVNSWVPNHIYTSPLKRAVQTTEILHQEFAHAQLRLPPVVYADSLKEFQNGILQGLTWTEAQAHYPQLCQTLEASLDWIPIPGAEALETARDRAQQFIQRLLQNHIDSDQIWVITHQWILQHLIAALLGCPYSWKVEADYTALFEFWLDRSRWGCTDQNRFNTELWQIRRFNDGGHLQA